MNAIEMRWEHYPELTCPACKSDEVWVRKSTSVIDENRAYCFLCEHRLVNSIQGLRLAFFDQVVQSDLREVREAKHRLREA